VTLTRISDPGPAVTVARLEGGVHD